MRAQTLVIAEIEFWLVGSPELLRTADGYLCEYSYVIAAEQRLNSHAAGPFCRFKLPAAPAAPGVYAILIDGKLKYIGRCEQLSARFGSSGYGSISPRNLHSDGQVTNCKLNSRILLTAKDGGIAQVWFHNTQDFEALESTLNRDLKPEWNDFPGKSIRHQNSRSTRPARPMKEPRADAQSVAGPAAAKEDFDRELRLLLLNAAAEGLRTIEVVAGELHKLVGGYPGNNHRMPVCCARMRAAMSEGDQITYAPPKGNGARLSVEYELPR